MFTEIKIKNLEKILEEKNLSFDENDKLYYIQEIDSIMCDNWIEILVLRDTGSIIETFPISEIDIEFVQ